MAQKLKRKKAVGFDKILNEAWIYGGEDLLTSLTEVILKVWEEGEIPDDWQTALVVPLYKKEVCNEVGNYRGILLLSTAYKLYTELIRKRSFKEIEEKHLLSESQAGFRKGRSAMENIYVLNHLIQRE